ncbi:MAG: hypothetical protein RLZZ214_1191 [Verrucomicrobiota bacterium]|jgi:hypothetical protein
MKKIKTFNVVLCGPGDVAKEIAIARKVIEEWNQRNWEGLNCGLKDKHWDTDVAPSMDARGQAIINRDMIDSADLIVAIFWRRIGTPTGLHDSGTVEEITRAQARDIPVMLYFSDIEDTRPIQDSDQWDMLQAFRARALVSGLPRTFRSRDDFRKRLGDHLHMKIVELLAQKPKSKSKKPKPSIQQTATGTANVQLAGDGNTVNVKVPRDSRGKSARDLPGTIGAEPNMRTYAKYLVDKYIECRIEGEKRIQQYDRPFAPGSAHGILGKGFGVTNSVFQIAQSRFEEWVASAQNKIRRTVFAKNIGHDIFHSWEEHLRQRGIH